MPVRVPFLSIVAESIVAEMNVEVRFELGLLGLLGLNSKADFFTWTI
jgi:hypothetical protein